MEFHIIRGDQCDHLMTIHRCEKDEGPLQMVSAEKVKYWMQREVDYDALIVRLEADEKEQKMLRKRYSSSISPGEESAPE